MIKSLWVVAVVVAVLNVPFGFWRAGVRKFSLMWFISVHAPVPFIAVLRVLAGLSWHLNTVPALVAAYAAGQFLGGRLRRHIRPPE